MAKKHEIDVSDYTVGQAIAQVDRILFYVKSGESTMLSQSDKEFYDLCIDCHGMLLQHHGSKETVAKLMADAHKISVLKARKIIQDTMAIFGASHQTNYSYARLFFENLLSEITKRIMESGDTKAMARLPDAYIRFYGFEKDQFTEEKMKELKEAVRVQLVADAAVLGLRAYEKKEIDALFSKYEAKIRGKLMSDLTDTIAEDVPYTES